MCLCSHVVCVCVHSVASYVKFLNGKSSLVIAWIGDELHKGLALGKLDDEASDELCREHYKGYQGWTAPFRQKWFRSVLDFVYKLFSCMLWSLDWTYCPKSCTRVPF